LKKGKKKKKEKRKFHPGVSLNRKESKLQKKKIPIISGREEKEHLDLGPRHHVSVDLAQKKITRRRKRLFPRNERFGEKALKH